MSDLSVIPPNWFDEAEAFLAEQGINAAPLSSPSLREHFSHFLRLLLTKNQTVNLTGAKDMETLFWKHVVDSLLLLRLPVCGDLLDWGSGGGFPAVPLAIWWHATGDSRLVLVLDSVGKKVSAVSDICSTLRLPNVSFHTGRGEILSKTKAFASVQAVSFRAVAPADRCVRWMHTGIPDWVFFLGPQQIEDWKQQESYLLRIGFKKSALMELSLPRGIGQRALLLLSCRST